MIEKELEGKTKGMEGKVRSDVFCEYLRGVMTVVQKWGIEQVKETDEDEASRSSTPNTTPATLKKRQPTKRKTSVATLASFSSFSFVCSIELFHCLVYLESV